MEPDSWIEQHPDKPVINKTDLFAHAYDKETIKVAINRFFNSRLVRAPPNNDDCTEGTCFTSAYTLGQLLGKMDLEPNINSWDGAAVDHYGTGLIEFNHRPVEQMIRRIFRQSSHVPHMTYMPIMEFRTPSGYRMYLEMQTDRWWWEKQNSLSNDPKKKGHFVVPLIFGSDEIF
ncbi:hypothetical protein BJ508DRAFT_330707 [Ascobolus immersus RN42]|uniref:Uncharacterized protein n=1 Tax=Ascobolus immersus RN42 TaxID=1160509 RepID=A0A3N4HSK3_ASCIM|nr:hypothetical protein BJ508DRAFT_330707 [Ascobolus immersus RN42]